MGKALTFAEAFSVLNGMEVVFGQKTDGKLAIKLYKLTRPLKTLQEDYKELTDKISGEVGSKEWEANLIEINTSTFAEFDTITLEELENLELTPQCIVQLEPIIA